MSSELVPLFTQPAAQWDTLCQTQRAHLLQTYAWGELKSKFGWRVERLALPDDKTNPPGAQILYRRLAPGLTIAYLPRGPFGTPDQINPAFIEKLKKHVRARGAVLLKIEPDWPHNDPRTQTLRAAHAQPTPETIQPPATIHLDLTANLDTVLARMKPKWRYNIRLAERKDVTVRTGTRDDLLAFYELMRLTGVRDHFAIHDATYYDTAFQLLQTRGHAELLIAEYEHTPLAMIFVTAFADQAIYLYGASGNTERNRMPNHALHWAAIQWAKARGCSRYDLWGIPPNATDTVENENLPSSLYQFKQGFGGNVVQYTGAWDIVFDPVKHQLYKLARKLRKSAVA